MKVTVSADKRERGGLLGREMTVSEEKVKGASG